MCIRLRQDGIRDSQAVPFLLPTTTSADWGKTELELPQSMLSTVDGLWGKLGKRKDRPRRVADQSRSS